MIRRPCVKCGSTDTKKYLRKDSGTYRRECIPCFISQVLETREKVRAKDPKLFKEKGKEQMKLWRAKNKKVKAKGLSPYKKHKSFKKASSFWRNSMKWAVSG